MKRVITFKIMISLFINAPFVLATSLGEETIEPLRFPKFTLGGEYAVYRHLRAFGSDFKVRPKNSFGVNLHAEASLIKYLHGGFSVSMTSSTPFLGGSNVMRTILFLKPYLPLGSRFSLFARIGLGPAASIFNEAMAYLGMPDSAPGMREYLSTYGRQAYWPISGGINSTALAGLEYFFGSRLGVVAELGFRADMLWAKRMELTQKNGVTSRAPNWFHYLIYDLPIAISVHLIL